MGKVPVRLKYILVLYVVYNSVIVELILVFSSACQELGSCHSIPKASKKLNRLKTNLPWIHKRREDIGQTALSKIRETDRQTQGVST